MEAHITSLSKMTQNIQDQQAIMSWLSSNLKEKLTLESSEQGQIEIEKPSPTGKKIKLKYTSLQGRILEIYCQEIKILTETVIRF